MKVPHGDPCRLAIRILGGPHLEIAGRHRHVVPVLPDLRLTRELFRSTTVLLVDRIHIGVVIFRVRLHPAARGVRDPVPVFVAFLVVGRVCGHDFDGSVAEPAHDGGAPDDDVGFREAVLKGLLDLVQRRPLRDRHGALQRRDVVGIAVPRHSRAVA